MQEPRIRRAGWIRFKRARTSVLNGFRAGYSIRWCLIVFADFGGPFISVFIISRHRLLLCRIDSVRRLEEGKQRKKPHTRLGVWAWLCNHQSIKGSTEEDLGTKRYIKKNINSVDHVQVHS